jgi:hypothetical protein
MHFLFTTGGRRLTLAAALTILLLCGLILFDARLPAWFPQGLRADYSNRISICIFFLTAFVAFAAIPQLLSLADTSRSAHYAQLDTMYFDLLRMAVDRPYLRTPDSLPSGKIAEYESYAFAVWNFLETLRDRCCEDQALKDIWAPVVATEHAIHGNWFYRETTPYWEKEAPKFRLPFADFIWKRFGSPTAQVCGNVLHEESSRWISESWDLRDVDDIKEDAEIRPYLGEPSEHRPSSPP